MCRVTGRSLAFKNNWPLQLAKYPPQLLVYNRLPPQYVQPVSRSNDCVQFWRKNWFCRMPVHTCVAEYAWNGGDICRWERGRGEASFSVSRCGLVARRQAGKQKDLGPIRFGFPFSSEIVVYGHCLVTLPTQINNIKMAHTAADLNAESFWWWQCNE